MDNQYTITLRKHYEDHFGIVGNKLRWSIDPHKKLDPFFHVLEFPPNPKHNMWTYCSVGMSPGIVSNIMVELFIFSPKEDFTLVELLTVAASYHKNAEPLDIHHTFNIGRPWLDNSKCDHCFISLPYLDGEKLEFFDFGGKTTHCYWVIPITESEQNYKIEKGCNALEDLFEENAIDYINPQRKSLV
ncbi:suppressor of fused domain protein [Mucilaginibacter corticis]|uniref:Suppressor of fused domain protein n=1 Tax=Mucilaginibacter corticis TaxID=2597670 RepID=A0A556MFE0_9SPHI|nr:suppressor of fused domain protein [Mucilaginibacter corticis]TSJ38646.1 suppressor of fused domain protein [Mucilaginibacter corticis]